MANLNIVSKEEIYLRLERNNILKSKIHAFLPDDLIAIEQTQPPLKADYINRIILLTYREAEDKTRRFGFEARIKKISSDNRIVLQKINDPSPCDLRIWPRIRLDLLPNVRAFCHEKEIQVIDISAGGTHIILHSNECEAPEIGTIVQMKFIFDKGTVLVEGKILRKWKDASQGDHVAIEFCSSNNIGQFIY